MNFFQQQHEARRQTRKLVILFVLAVIGVVAAIDVVLVLVFAAAELKATEGQVFSFTGALREHPVALVVTSILTATVIGIASVGKTFSLRSGGKAVASGMGATQVGTGTSNPHHRRLRNVVEEMAIASGVPVPEIYVLEQEAGINAFAAGFTPSDAAVVVTRGAMEKLSRDELQGVVAHEFSHILNGDMRLNIRLMGVLFGILVVGLIGRKILEGMRHTRDSKGLGPILIAALAIMVLGYVGLFIGRMIKAGISRKREFLADASAVQFTRQTDGLAGALKKVGGLTQGSKLDAGDSEDVSHMLFCDGIGFSGLFATHPPLLDRIRVLDKAFDPRQFGDIHKRWSGDVDILAFDDELALAGRSGLAASAPTKAPASGKGKSRPSELPGAAAEVRIDAHTVAAQVGNPASDDYRVADALHAKIPDRLKQAARDPAQAEALLLALMIDRGTRAAQLELVGASAGSTAVAHAEALGNALDDLHPMMRLPLANIAFPALRRLPRARLTLFLSTLEQLMHADGQISPYEFCLATLVRVQVVDFLDPPNAKAFGKSKLNACKDEAVGLLALLAHHGHEHTSEAERAFQAGASALFQGEHIRYAPADDWRRFFDQTLPKLDRLDATGKQLLIEALVRAISQDGLLSVPEAEFLRVVCAALHCPLPPVLSL